MSDVPKFDLPPVNEVVMSVQFEPVLGLTIAHLAAWWQDEARQRYPKVQERPPVDAQVEQFDIGGPTFSLQFGGGVAPVALWLFNEADTELVQLQANRFTRNWTRGSNDDYPSYAALKPRFDEDFRSFREHLLRQELPPLVATQCELTYLNPIDPDEHWSRPGQLDRIIAPWSGGFSDQFLPEPEDVRIGARWVVEEDGVRLGRLTAEVIPLAGPTAKVLLTLQSRLRPLGPGQTGIDASLDLSHDWIVRSFASLTTAQMWKTWRRTR